MAIQAGNVTPIFTDTQQQIIERIKFGAVGISNKDIAKNIVRHWRNSPQIKDMLTAQEYHLVNNTGIDSKSREYLVPVRRDDGSYGEEKRENKTLSNIKLKSASMRTSVEQKINYGFTNPFVFEVSLEGQKPENEEPQELITYRNEWNAFLNDDNRDTIKRIATDALVNGKGWAYISTDEDGKLQITDMFPNTIYPEWADRAHKRIDALVRDYVIIQYSNNLTPETIRKVEFWNKDTVEFYIDDGGDWIIDNDMEAFVLGNTPPPTEGGIPHLKTTGWGRVPLISLKANPDELPLLNIVKTYFDLLDWIKSKMADTLLDDMDAILMLKKIAPSLIDLINSRVNIKNSGVVVVDADGDAKYIKNDVNVDAAAKAIEIYYKDFLQHSSTVDMQSDGQAIRQTQDALKMMYQPLDIYMNGVESHFREFMKNLKYYFDKALEIRNIGTAETWAKYKTNATLDRDMEVSEAEIIDNIMKLGDEISQETRDSQNPYVIDHETEQSRRDAEAKKRQVEEKRILDQMSQFRQTIQNQGDGEVV